MKTYVQKLLICTASFLLLAQFSAQDTSVSGRDKPKVNFYGTLIEESGDEYPVENITIKNRYKDIVMYKKPTKMNSAPDHEVRIDLNEEREFQVPRKGESPIIYKFKSREYIEIDVVSNDAQRTKNTYIIEAGKIVSCDQKIGGTYREHTLSFRSIRSLIIKGYKDRDVKPEASS